MSMQSVSDIRSNESDQFVYAAKKLGSSQLKKKVFTAVYFGKQRIKTVGDIAKATGLSRKTVLDNANKLVTDHLIHQEERKHQNDTAYSKDNSYKGNWRKILNAAGNKKKIDGIKTKVNPGRSTGQNITIKILGNQAKTKQITIDHISSFAKVKKIRTARTGIAKIAEAKMKAGILKILGEKGKPPKDWGG